MTGPSRPVLKKHDSPMIRRKIDPPRGVLATGGGRVRRFRHERYHPSPDLEAYVEHYWVVEWDLRGQPSERAETLPHPSVHMIFDPLGGSRIRGPAHAKFSRVLEGRGEVFAVKFTPAGFYPFASGAVSRFTDVAVTLRRVFGAEGGALDRAVLAAPGDQSRMASVEDFLRGRRPAADDNVQRISALVYAAAKDRRILKVDDLVDRSGLSQRTLQRLFDKYVGVNPKWVIQRYRLHEAAERLVAGPASHAALALELGYCDQAHFVRDFKAIVGVSPAAYVRAARQAAS
jgi:AraC-like DNA-binding protein